VRNTAWTWQHPVATALFSLSSTATVDCRFMLQQIVADTHPAYHTHKSRNNAADWCFQWKLQRRCCTIAASVIRSYGIQYDEGYKLIKMNVHHSQLYTEVLHFVAAAWCGGTNIPKHTTGNKLLLSKSDGNSKSLNKLIESLKTNVQSRVDCAMIVCFNCGLKRYGNPNKSTTCPHRYLDTVHSNFITHCPSSETNYPSR
jgi:hypothetical protein